jgi:flagellar hook-associated protein 2
MATNNSVNSSSTGSRLDVASIVSQLMEIERRPVKTIESKLAVSSVKISSLGQFESKLAAFRDALDSLQAVKSQTRASSSNSSAIDVTASPTAELASFEVAVQSIATKQVTSIAGFASRAEAIDWLANSAPQAVTDKADALILEQAPNQVVLRLQAKTAGMQGAFSLGSALDGTTLVSTEITAADATFTIDGVAFTRGSNTVADVIPGLTVDLKAVTINPVAVSVSKERTSPAERIDAFAKAYNDLLNTYKALTKSSIDQGERGALNSDSSVLTAMRQITDSLLSPLTNSAGESLSGRTDLSRIGLRLRDGGELTFDASLAGSAADLAATFNGGIRIGFVSGANRDLSQQVAEMTGFDGLISSRVSAEKTIQSQLNSKKILLEEKLLRTQQRLTAEYAALDALLFRLSATSESLKTSLDAILNQGK